MTHAETMARWWRRRPLTRHPCVVCGELFESRCTVARYCSPRCRGRFAEQTAKNKQTCPVCRRRFDANRYRPNKTCSRRCGAILRHHPEIRKKDSA